MSGTIDDEQIQRIKRDNQVAFEHARRFVKGIRGVINSEMYILQSVGREARRVGLKSIGLDASQKRWSPTSSSKR